MKIVIADKGSPSTLKIFAENSDWTVVSPDKESLAGELGNADAILVRSATFVDAAMMDKAPRLRVIGRAGVGVDNVDLDAATKRGIVVMNTPGGNAVAVAEHTFALMLALARQLTRADATMHAGKWESARQAGIPTQSKLTIDIASTIRCTTITATLKRGWISWSKNLKTKTSSLAYTRFSHLLREAQFRDSSKLARRPRS